jgi:hypothetical protein
MARSWITKSNQYVAHRDVKVARQVARNEIEFGLDTYLELKQREWDEYFYSFDDCCSCEECIGFNWRDRLKVS